MKRRNQGPLVLASGRTVFDNFAWHFSPADGGVLIMSDGSESGTERFDGTDSLLTDDERREFARHMIDAWARWAETGSPGDPLKDI